MTADKRQHPRYAIELDTEAEFEGQRFVGRTHDISRGGFCLHLAQPLSLGSMGTVKLALVFSENSFSEQLVLPATIMWCTPLAGAYQVGFQFGELSAEVNGYLTLFIELLEVHEDEDDDDPAATHDDPTNDNEDGP